MSCSCQTNVISEGSDDSSFEENKLSDPTIIAYKKALKDFTPIIQSAQNSTDGKQLGDAYWEKITELLKKAKLGIAMFELGLDGEDGLAGDGDDVTPMGDVRDGDQQLDNKKAEDEEEGGEEGGGEAPPPADGGEAPPPAKKAPPPAKKEEPEDDSEEEPEDSDASTNPDPESYRESVHEASKSASQQRLFGMVYALKNGDLKKDSVTKTLWEKIKKIADGISLKNAKDFAKTKHSNLSERLPATESKESLLESARHLGIILESEGSKIKSVVHFNGGLVVEINKNATTHCVCIGEQISLEGINYSVSLGDKTDFGLVANNFNRISKLSDSELESIDN